MTVTRDPYRVVLHAENDFEKEAIAQALRQGVEAVTREPLNEWNVATENDALVLKLRDPNRW